MKKLIQAASLVSAGAAVLTCSQVLAAQGGSKPWSLSLGLRGFYDDNIFTGNNQATGNRPKVDAFGFEVTPGVQFNVPLDQTTITGGYTYGLRYFVDRPGKDYDQFHSANLGLVHQFSPRYKLSVYDNFAAGQEPELVAPPSVVGGTASQVVRSEGSNVRNTAGVDFSADISPQWSAVLGYQNNWYNYNFAGFANVLNRVEHLPSLRAAYHLSPRTSVGVGYQYGDVNYTRADYRDQRSHYLFVHADHSFTSQLIGSVRGGAQFVDWYNAPANGRDNATNPYVDANLSYSYTTGSNAQIGVRHSRNATDVDDLSLVNSVYDQQSTLVYASINHAFTGRLSGSLIGQYQNAEFIGVTSNNPYDGQTENYLTVGVSLDYRFSAYLTGTVAYYFDRISSDISFRDYDRNRVFIGVRATY